MVDLFKCLVEIDCQAHWWLATSHSPQLETSHDNKMTFHFAVVDYEKIVSINKAAFMKNKNRVLKMVKYGWEM